MSTALWHFELLVKDQSKVVGKMFGSRTGRVEKLQVSMRNTCRVCYGGTRNNREKRGLARQKWGMLQSSVFGITGLF